MTTPTINTTRATQMLLQLAINTTTNFATLHIQHNKNTTTMGRMLLNSAYSTTFNESNFNTTLATPSDGIPEFPKDKYVLLKKMLFSLILVLSMVGNLLLITSIIFVKRLRQMKCNYLIFHLALSDIVMTLFSVPFNLRHLDVESGVFYPFQEWTCKSVWPIATYATNCSALTLTCIAIERFMAVSSLCMRHEKLMVILMIIVVQLVSVGSAIPYAITLRYLKFEDAGVAFCYEEWEKTDEQKAYTILLFTLQYGLPFLCITFFYSMTWRQIMKRNERMIKVSEEYERKISFRGTINRQQSRNTTIMNTSSSTSSSTMSTTDIEDRSYSEATTVEQNNNGDLNYKQHQTSVHLKSSFRRKGSVVATTLMRIRTARIIRKPRFISQTAYIRHRQTLRTLKMFTATVVLFTVFALPNQIVWLMADFNEEQHVPLVLVHVFVFFTYTNAVANCWVYSFFNKHFRKAYTEMLVKLLPCLKYCCRQMMVMHHDYQSSYYTKSSAISMTVSASRQPQQADEDQQNRFDERQRAFAKMFDDHLNNAEQFEHLYKDAQEKNGENTQLLLSPAPGNTANQKRRLTLASLASLVFTPTASRKTSKTNMRDSSLARENIDDEVEALDTEHLIPIEQLKVKTRRAKSASDLRRNSAILSDNTNNNKGPNRRSIWSMISPLQSRRKSSTNAPSKIPQSSTMPDINSSQRDNDSACARDNEEKERMVYPSKVKVQKSKSAVRKIPVIQIRGGESPTTTTSLIERKLKTFSSPPVRPCKKLTQSTPRKLSLGSNIQQKKSSQSPMGNSPISTHSSSRYPVGENNPQKEELLNDKKTSFGETDCLNIISDGRTKVNGNVVENPDLMVLDVDFSGDGISEDNLKVKSVATKWSDKDELPTRLDDEDESTEKLIHKLEKLNQFVVEAKSQSNDEFDDRMTIERELKNDYLYSMEDKEIIDYSFKFDGLDLAGVNESNV